MGDCRKIHRPWTPEEMDRVNELRLEGRPFSYIGKDLNRSRCSVASVVARMREGRRRTGPTEPPPPYIEAPVRLERLQDPIKKRTAEIIAASHCDLSPILDQRRAAA